MTSGRGSAILARFPAHLEAWQPDKLLTRVVDAPALALDAMAAALAAVRRAHRLADADEYADLMRLASLLGMGAAEFEIVLQRWRRARELLASLQEAADEGARETAAAALAALWSLQVHTPGEPLLPVFADPAAPADTARAAARLIDAARLALRQQPLNDAVRTRIAVAAAAHAGGNGTVLALLRGAANALDLELDEVVHSADRYWHAARVTDRLRLSALIPAEELLGIEENPLWRDATDHTPRSHADLFTVLRRGFERALLQVTITGSGSRTVHPMLVNRDEGHGIGFAGHVPNGEQIVFDEAGRVLLSGSDVTARCFAWQGGCFAGDDASADADFVFAGDGLAASARPARFATMLPPSAIDREASFPSAGVSLPIPGIEVGVTRLAFFVREGHFAATPALQPTPLTRSAVFDASVFAPPPLPRSASALVSLSWLEHRAFAVRLLIPPRFRRWRAAEADGAQTLQALARALQRHRPVGVELQIEFIDDRWTLGGGTLTSGIDDDVIESLRAATSLWAAPADA